MQNQPDLDIAIVDAEIAGFGASGRNGGWCSAYFAGLEALWQDPARRDGAIRLQRHMIDALAEIERVTRAESIDCGFDRCGHVAVAVAPAQLERLRDQVETLRALGVAGTDCRRLDTRELGIFLDVRGAMGGYWMAHCAAVQPAGLVRGLANAVERRGVTLYERTPALNFTAGRVTTPDGRIRARHVLLATEGYSGALPGTRRKLVPVHSRMIATEPLDDGQLAATGLNRRICFNNLNHLVTYGQLTADRRLAFGCRGHYLFGSGVQRTFDPAQPEFTVVREELLQFFPHLRGVRFTHAWGGALGASRDLTPAVCHDKRSGAGWAGGYFGDGVAASHLAGRTLADLVLGRDSERTRLPWVNPPEVRHLDQGLWEPEPLRWLGIQAVSRLRGWADAAERRDSALAPALRRSIGWLSP